MAPAAAADRAKNPASDPRPTGFAAEPQKLLDKSPAMEYTITTENKIY